VEFRSKLEDLMPAEELIFEPTPGFGPYKRFLEHAIAHPAKMNTKLLKFLIKNFTQQDDVILDPMCGSGSTGVVAALHGRNAVQVDIEKKFVDWAEEAKRKVEAQATLTAKGLIRNICGDSRKLSELLKEADVVVTSPPYSETIHKRADYSKRVERLEGKGIDFQSLGKSVQLQDGEEYVKSEGNIANLPHGEISAIITRPPYGEAQDGHGIAKEGYRGDKHSPTDLVGKRSYMPDKFESEQNISRLKYDAVITSPPYAETYVGGGDSEKRKERLEKAGHNPKDFLGGKARNAVLKHYSEVDAVITSPPYAIDPKNVCHTKEGKTLEDYDKKRGFKPTAHPRIGYSPNKQNIGNLPMKVDAVITSPPYADGSKGKERTPLFERLAQDPTSNRYGRKSHPHTGEGYGNTKQNIGNLPFDAVITSPPYDHSVSDDKEGPLAGGNEEKYGRWRKGTARKHSYSQGGEPCKVDAVITSPPYEGSLEGSSRHTKGGIASRDPALAQTGTYATRLSFGVPVGYSPNKDNIGNLKSKDQEYETLVDSIITSPPYAHESSAAKPTKLEKQGLFKMGHSSEEAYTDEDYREWNKHKGGNIGKRKLFIRIPCGKEEAQFHDTRKGRKGTIWEYTSEVEATPEIIEQVQQLKSERKGKSETYLEAMLKCYQEMFKVLKPDGKAIIVIKPFIRNKKVVDLPYHTWLLLEKVGFKLVKLFKLRLQQESFWRILYSQKFPKVPKIAHEWILICEKP